MIELALPSDNALLLSALALSSASGRAFRWKGFGRKRSRRKGSLESTADTEVVRFFAGMTGASVEGATVGLEPGELTADAYRFDVAPNEPLLPLLRMALLPLARAGGGRSVTLTGATHAPGPHGGETFEVFDSTFRYLLRSIGIDVSSSLDCAGFAPRGGGEITARIGHAGWTPLTLVEREPLESIQIVSSGASLPAHVQQRQAARARSGVHISGIEPTVQLLKIRARSAGSVVAVTGQFGDVPITFASVSERGKSAESVGEEAAARFRRYANQPAVVPEGLVGPLLPFLALAEGESQFTTPRLPATAAGHAALIRAFTDVDVDIEGKVGQPARIAVGRLANAK